MHTTLRSATREVVIGPDRPFCVIGERINPTGRKVFAEQLRRGDLSRVEIDVAQQVAGGAMVLDVNMGAPLADEAELMSAAVRLIQSRTDLPLCLDSSIVGVLEAGLAAYQGKALVNSVTAEDERLEAILPLVARHGAAVIGLPNDEQEIPEDPRRRLELAGKIIDVATGRYGIPVEDVIIDPLAMPVGADTSVVLRTLETLDLLRERYGVNTTLGASNISFGMPDRTALTAAFLPMAAAAGLTSAIMDARSPELVRAVRACDLLLNRDEWGAAWIAAHRAGAAAATAGPGAPPRRSLRWPRPGTPGPPSGRGRPEPARPAGWTWSSLPRGPGCACQPGSPSSTRRAGTASPSIRPAAATARARSARSGSPAARSPPPAWTPARSPPSSCGTAGGWPAGRPRPPACGSRCRRSRPGPRRRRSAWAGR